MKKSLCALLLISLLPALISCGGGGQNSALLGILPGEISKPTSNIIPVANAGLTQNVNFGSLVTLDGTASRDENNSTLAYVWEMTSIPAGSKAVLSSVASAKPTFTADLAGIYRISLVVNDGKDNSLVSYVSVVASLDNSAPVANAGVSQNVALNSLVRLDGTASSDANLDALTYRWSFLGTPTGSKFASITSTSPAPTFTPDVAGIYVISLIVNDGKIDSKPSAMTVNVSAANSAPVAVPGNSQNVSVATLVTLDGTSSTDANFDFLTYRWNIITKPTGSTSALSSLSSPKPTFTPDKAGVYVATLIVNDGKVDSEVAATSVTVSAANSAPVANAGNNQTVLLTAVVTLSGSSSTDANAGDILTYKWTLTSKPTGSTATLSSATAVAPTFVADLAGVYVATLIINDGKVDSNVATVAISAN
jgi:hypothetical protein